MTEQYWCVFLRSREVSIRLHWAAFEAGFTQLVIWSRWHKENFHIATLKFNQYAIGSFSQSGPILQHKFMLCYNLRNLIGSKFKRSCQKNLEFQSSLKSTVKFSSWHRPPKTTTKTHPNIKCQAAKVTTKTLVQRYRGAVPSPFECYLMTRSLKTLKVSPFPP